MLSFKPVEDSGGAAHYFESSDDYYENEGHKGRWEGAGAGELGLEGAIVDQSTFKAMLDGYLPSGQQVRHGKTAKSADRKGIDFTFSAPKSVSIQALVHGDTRLLKAHEASVRAALQELQLHAAARKKERGLSFRERTNKLVVATFRHELSRAQDPQLHSHAIVMNMTQRSDGKWRALANEDMLNNVKVVGAFYRAHLASELRSMGYELRETRKGGWELAHVSDDAIRLFSQRSQEIEKLLKARGQDRDSASTAQKQIITLASRKKKSDVDRAWLRQHWLDTARDAGVDLAQGPTLTGTLGRTIEKVTEHVRLAVTGTNRSTETADEAVKFAIEHLSERQGLFSRSEVLEVAYARAATKSDPAAVDRALERIKESGSIVTELPLYQTARSLNSSAEASAKDRNAQHFKGLPEHEKLTRASWIALTMQVRGQSQPQAEETVDQAIKSGALASTEERYTTREARQSEIRILAIERAGRQKLKPILQDDQVETLLAEGGLNEGQAASVRMILTSEDRFVGIQGIAGAGKSHMMSRTVRAIKERAAEEAGKAGYEVIGLAPYAAQNKALQELGMASSTLASFLARKKAQEAVNPKTIVFLDEASVVPAHQMEHLMKIIETRGARLVLVGDRKQTQAVEAGKPFEQLQDAGMRVSYLTEIVRQKNATIKAAVVSAAEDKIAKAVALLRDHTTEIGDHEQRYKAIAKRYASLTPSERASTLIVAGTNEARQKINNEIRQRLGLGSSGDDVNTLERIDMTRAEIKSARSYERGQVLVPDRDYKVGLRKGEQYSVVGVNVADNVLRVRDQQGVELAFNPTSASQLRAFTINTIKLAVDEPVTITRNDPTTGLRNGEQCRVVGVDGAAVTIERKDGTRMALARGVGLHLRYAYTSTVHSAQGLTNDRVLIDANTSSLTANRAVFYVAVSRPRHHIEVFTNDKERLAKAMSRTPKKFAALELRDERNEAFFLQGRVEHALRAKLQASLRKQGTTPKTTRQARTGL